MGNLERGNVLWPYERCWKEKDNLAWVLKSCMQICRRLDWDTCLLEFWNKEPCMIPNKIILSCVRRCRVTLSTDIWPLTQIWCSAFGYICFTSPHLHHANHSPAIIFCLFWLSVSYQTKNEFLTLSASLLLSSSIIVLVQVLTSVTVLFDIVCSFLWNCVTIWND